VTSPEQQHGIAPGGEQEQPPKLVLEPRDVKILVTVSALILVILFSKQYYPAPREALRNVRMSFLILSLGASPLIHSLGKWRSNVPVAVATVVVVLYGLLSLYLGFVEPHRLIPWFLHPLVVVFMLFLVVIVTPLPPAPPMD
jgi:hypothetical protein